MDGALDRQAALVALDDATADDERHADRRRAPVAERELAGDDRRSMLRERRHAEDLVEDRPLDAAMHDARRAGDVRGWCPLALDPDVRLEELEAETERVVGAAPEAAVRRIGREDDGPAHRASIVSARGLSHGPAGAGRDGPGLTGSRR